jgi:hypothetical protein
MGRIKGSDKTEERVSSVSEGEQGNKIHTFRNLQRQAIRNVDGYLLVV